MSSVQDSKCIANNAGEVAVNNKKNRRKNRSDRHKKESSVRLPKTDERNEEQRGSDTPSTEDDLRLPVKRANGN